VYAKIIFVTALVLTCTAMSFYFKQRRKPVVYESRITVTGNAKNISGHAAVVAPSTDIYYVGTGLAQPGNKSNRRPGKLG
jgi:hypothetical protein